jgi:hypothetical protein
MTSLEHVSLLANVLDALLVMLSTVLFLLMRLFVTADLLLYVRFIIIIYSGLCYY